MNKELHKKFYMEKQSNLDKYKKQNRRYPTRQEKAFYDILKQNQINFTSQKYFYSKEFCCIVDFFIKTGGSNIVIEIDGGYHYTSEQARKDRFREMWLIRERKCKVIRFTNELIDFDINRCLLELADYFLSICQLKNSNNYKIFKFIYDANEPNPTRWNN